MGGGKAAGVFGRRGPRHPRLADLGSRAALPLFERLLASRGLVGFDSKVGRARFALLREAIGEGREAYVLGVGVGFHNAGDALVRVTAAGSDELICNEEE